ncbi:MAG: nucleotide exchange factor GrpE [Actinobacteria bacterium]|nr:nucleotide exchange factor GrpE [Actinomycetota bacterium]
MTAPDEGRLADDPDRVIVRDRRRLDPETGAVRDVPPVTADPGAPGSEESAPEPPAGPDPVAELTADLQRVSAEYANYRKRVDRDRVAVVEMATAGLLSGLLPVLDDIDRARQHDDVHGAFKGVAEKLQALTGKLGLEQFGAAGDPFDPSVHEALMQAEPDPEVTVATCAMVLQPGYRLASGTSGGPRILRPARVSVAEPAVPLP